MLYYLLVFIHIILCIALVFFILIQSNKGLGLGGAFGSFGGATENLFASGSMNILVKITIVLALFFAMTSIALTIVTPPVGQSSILEDSAISVEGRNLKDFVDETRSGQTGSEVPPPGQGAQEQPVVPQQ